MEKTISQDERIRRAEEIYYRKKAYIPKGQSVEVNVSEKKSFGLLKKMTIQIICCALIYTTFFTIKNSNYIFSEEVINKTKEILEYDINFQSLYNQLNTYINKYKGEEVTNPTNEIEQENETITETLSATDNVSEETNSETNEVVQTEETSSISLMDEDAKYIKENYSVIKPLEGTITSRYGVRNPTAENVSLYHTGIDIARNEGTVIVAAMEGTVELVSSEGSYRKSYTNSKW